MNLEKTESDICNAIDFALSKNVKLKRDIGWELDNDNNNFCCALGCLLFIKYNGNHHSWKENDHPSIYKTLVSDVDFTMELQEFFAAGFDGRLFESNPFPYEKEKIIDVVNAYNLGILIYQKYQDKISE